MGTTASSSSQILPHPQQTPSPKQHSRSRSGSKSQHNSPSHSNYSISRASTPRTRSILNKTNPDPKLPVSASSSPPISPFALSSLKNSFGHTRSDGVGGSGSSSTRHKKSKSESTAVPFSGFFTSASSSVQSSTAVSPAFGVIGGDQGRDSLTSSPRGAGFGVADLGYQVSAGVSGGEEEEEGEEDQEGDDSDLPRPSGSTLRRLSRSPSLSSISITNRSSISLPSSISTSSPIPPPNFGIVNNNSGPSSPNANDNNNNNSPPSNNPPNYLSNWSRPPSLHQSRLSVPSSLGFQTTLNPQPSSFTHPHPPPSYPYYPPHQHRSYSNATTASSVASVTSNATSATGGGAASATANLLAFFKGGGGGNSSGNSVGSSLRSENSGVFGAGSGGSGSGGKSVRNKDKGKGRERTDSEKSRREQEEEERERVKEEKEKARQVELQREKVREDREREFEFEKERQRELQLGLEIAGNQANRSLSPIQSEEETEAQAIARQERERGEQEEQQHFSQEEQVESVSGGRNRPSSTLTTRIPSLPSSPTFPITRVSKASGGSNTSSARHSRSSHPNHPIQPSSPGYFTHPYRSSEDEYKPYVSPYSLPPNLQLSHQPRSAGVGIPQGQQQQQPSSASHNSRTSNPDRHNHHPHHQSSYQSIFPPSNSGPKNNMSSSRKPSTSSSSAEQDALESLYQGFSGSGSGPSYPNLGPGSAHGGSQGSGRSAASSGGRTAGAGRSISGPMSLFASGGLPTQEEGGQGLQSPTSYASGVGVDEDVSSEIAFEQARLEREKEREGKKQVLLDLLRGGKSKSGSGDDGKERASSPTGTMTSYMTGWTGAISGWTTGTSERDPETDTLGQGLNDGDDVTVNGDADGLAETRPHSHLPSTDADSSVAAVGNGDADGSNELDMDLGEDADVGVGGEADNSGVDEFGVKLASPARSSPARGMKPSPRPQSQPKVRAMGSPSQQQYQHHFEHSTPTSPFTPPEYPRTRNLLSPSPRPGPEEEAPVTTASGASIVTDATAPGGTPTQQKEELDLLGSSPTNVPARELGHDGPTVTSSIPPEGPDNEYDLGPGDGANEIPLETVPEEEVSKTESDLYLMEDGAGGRDKERATTEYPDPSDDALMAPTGNEGEEPLSPASALMRDFEEAARRRSQTPPAHPAPAPASATATTMSLPELNAEEAAQQAQRERDIEGKKLLERLMSGAGGGVEPLSSFEPEAGNAPESEGMIDPAYEFPGPAPSSTSTLPVHLPSAETQHQQQSPIALHQHTHQLSPRSRDQSMSPEFSFGGSPAPTFSDNAYMPPPSVVSSTAFTMSAGTGAGAGFAPSTIGSTSPQAGSTAQTARAPSRSPTTVGPSSPTIKTGLNGTGGPAGQPQKSPFDYISPFDFLQSTYNSTTGNKTGPAPTSRSEPAASVSPLSAAEVQQGKKASLDSMRRDRQQPPRNGRPPATESDQAREAVQLKNRPSALNLAEQGYANIGNSGSASPAPEPSTSTSKKGDEREKRVAFAQGAQVSPVPKKKDKVSRKDKEPSPGPSFPPESDEPNPKANWMAGRWRAETMELEDGSKRYGSRLSGLPPSTPLLIDCSKPLHDSLFTDDVRITPITRFTTPVAFETGRKVAVTKGGFISYATKQGRIRVIDRLSGARLLLKSHSHPIIDMAISPVEGSSPFPSAGAKCLASCGLDGRLMVWRIPNRFEQDSVDFKIAAEIVGPSNPGVWGKFTRVQWHPIKPDVLAVATNESQLLLLDLTSDEWLKMVKARRTSNSAAGGGGAEAVSWDEVAGNLKTVYDVGAPIKHMAFSPDSTLLALYTDDGVLSIRPTVNPSRVLFTPLNPIAEPGSSTVSHIQFVSFHRSHPRCILISRHEGNLIEIYEIPHLAQPDARPIAKIDFMAPLAGVPPDLPPVDQKELFCHASYCPGLATLFISNSLRASVFAFHLEFPRTGDDTEILMASMTLGDRSNNLMDNATFLQALLKVSENRREASPQRRRPAVAIDYVVEMPSPDNIISFIADDRSVQDEVLVFSLHPKGIDQVHFPMEALVPLRDEPESRRMSLEHSVHVDVQTQVSVEGTNGMEETAKVPPVSSAALIPPLPPPDAIDNEPAVALESLGRSGPAPPDPNALPSELAQSQMKLAGSVINGAIRNIKSQKEKGKDKDSPPAPNQVPPPPAPAPAPSHRQSDSSPAQNGDLQASIVREMKKMEDSLHTRMSKMIAKETEKQQQRLEEERQRQNSLDINRQTNILRLVSDSLSGNTKKLLESTIKSEIKSVVLPSIAKVVSESVSDQIAKGVSEALKRTLPNELERLLLRPDITNSMARNFGSTVAPLVERNVQSVIHTTIVPQFREGTQGLLDALMSEVRGEMVDVRKEIVSEQSEAVGGMESEIRDLREGMEGLRHQVESLERTLARSLGQVASAMPQNQNTYQHQPQPQRHHQPPSHEPSVHFERSPQEYAQPHNVAPVTIAPQPIKPIKLAAPSSVSSMQTTPPQSHTMNKLSLPDQGHLHHSQHHSTRPQRPTTPPSRYEDMCLNALHGKGNLSLVGLIDQAPPHRLRAIFGPQASGGSGPGSGSNSAAGLRDGTHPSQANVSQAVILTLTHRIAQELEATDGFLLENGRRRLNWLMACIGAVDEGDPMTADYLKRILEVAQVGLVNREKKLESIGDMEGAVALEEAIHIVQSKREI